MNWEGRYLVIGFAAGDIPARAAEPHAAQGLRYRRRVLGRLDGARSQDGLANLTADHQLDRGRQAEAACLGKIPLARAGEAIRLLMDRKAQGKVVV
jgi:NADPH2:quinone reductase